MFIHRKDIQSLSFDGLSIIDYTAGRDTRSSFAEITVPPGVRHKVSWSKRSDKFYYVIQGQVDFTIGNQKKILSAGDVCIVPKEVNFFYQNNGPEEAKLILVHTPDFQLEHEVFE